MKAIFLNKEGNQIATYNGRGRNGMFEYTEQSSWDLLGIFAKKHEPIEFDYNLLVQVGKERIAFYRYDGKNIEQQSLHSTAVKSIVADYNTNWKLLEYAKKDTLKKPGSYEDILKWLLIIVAVVGLIINAFIVNGELAQLSKAYSTSPLQNITKTASNLASSCIASNRNISKLYNAILKIESIKFKFINS